MKKTVFLKLVQDRLPDDIIIQDVSQHEFTEDECIGMLSWIQYFNEHYKEFKKEKLPTIQNPYISTKLKLDFGLYRIPCDIEINKGKYIIYIIEIKKNSNNKIASKIDLKRLKIK